MKNIIITICLLIATLPVALHAQTKNADEKIYRTEFMKYIELMDLRESFKAVIPQMLGTFKDGMGAKVPESYWASMEKQFAASELDSLIEKLIPVYMKHLAIADLIAPNNFLSSPSGKSYVKAQTLVQMESIEIGEVWRISMSEKIINKLEKDGYGLK